MRGRRASRLAIAVFLCALLWTSIASRATAVAQAAPPISGGAAVTTRAWAHDAAAVSALADPQVQKRLQDIGQELPTREQQSTAGFAAFHKEEVEKWWPIIKAAGLKIE